MKCFGNISPSSSSSSSSHNMISVVQAHSASGTCYKVSVTCGHCQKERENRYVFSAAENDATLGTAVTKFGKAFHARVAMTGNERSPSVARRVTGTTSVDDDDDRSR